MSRASIDRQHPLRTDDDTPDLDERTRKKVRWNSDSVMEGDKEGELEDSFNDAKVGFFLSIHINAARHLTPTRHQLARRFV
jgi:hypothetical protein